MDSRKQRSNRSTTYDTESDWYNLGWPGGDGLWYGWLLASKIGMEGYNIKCNAIAVGNVPR